MKVFVGYLYTDASGKVSPGLEIVLVTDKDIIKACEPFLYSGEPIPYNEPIFSEIVEDVPLGMRKDGVYIMEMLAA